MAHGEDEALRFANMSDYGLSSAVVGRDVERATAFALKIDAGMTHVNDMTVADEQHVPFGGEKNSGLGRFNGRWILEEMTGPTGRASSTPRIPTRSDPILPARPPCRVTGLFQYSGRYFAIAVG